MTNSLQGQAAQPSHVVPVQSTPFMAWVNDALHHAHRMSIDEEYRQEVALRINPPASQVKQENKL